MKKAEAGKGDLFTGKAKQLNEVAEDANWRIAVNTELKSADQWNEDWGFLVAHQNGGKLFSLIFTCRVCVSQFMNCRYRSSVDKGTDEGWSDKKAWGTGAELKGQVNEQDQWRVRSRSHTRDVLDGSPQQD